MLKVFADNISTKHATDSNYLSNDDNVYNYLSNDDNVYQKVSYDVNL